MRRTPRFQPIVSLLILPVLLATSLAARIPQNQKQAEMSLTIVPARATLMAGETQKFSAHLEGAPAGTVVRWVITDVQRRGSSINQNGVFTAGTLGVYHVAAVATIGESMTLKTARVKVTVLGESEF